MTRAQLRAAGVSRHAISHAAKVGALHRVHRGVYIVGHLALAPFAKEAAALLACGDRAVISHRSAAHIWGLVDAPPQLVDVTVVGRRCRPKEGVRIHTLSRIDDRDVRHEEGLWLTAPAHTLIDLAPDSSLDELERLISETRIKGLLPNGELERALERAGRRRGTARIRAYLSAEEDEEYTRSKGERRMRQLLRAAGLPLPRVNTRAAGYEIDFLWEEERVIVEVDGFRFHGHRRAFERDRRKDMALTAAGYLVIRLTWNQLKNEPFTVIAHIARALDRGARAAGAARSSG